MLTLHPLIPRTARCLRRHYIVAAALLVAIVYVTRALDAYFDTVEEFSDIVHDLRAQSMFRYKWPLEVDTQKIIREYKEGRVSVKPITLDNTTITLFPHKQYCGDKTLVTVLIKTRVEDRYNRDLLRRTWIKDLYTHKLQHSFLIGQCKSRSCLRNLTAELSEHQDMIQGDFIDAYYNNTLKFTMGLRYIAYHCSTTRYMLMIDGDYSLNVNNLVQYLKDRKYPSDLYAGQLWPSSRPFRNITHPQYMSFDFYPFRLLPPFIAAGASLMSVEIIEPMDIIAKFTKFVKYDDVFYAMVARKLKIPLVDASDLIPSWTIPKIGDIQGHRSIIGSHRFGNLTEVEMIHRMIHSS